MLVHGEPERNDMVQYFAENLDGFAVTENGWVQSYGSRCTRPSILWGDVSRPAPITVEWSVYTQCLTEKPVKGMLTGPVTILAWSFVRDDQPLGETARQVALALRDEIADLEAAGIGIVQVDEPALRELLPLKKKDHADYLDWSVGSFRLATAGVAEETQIHTHLCYSEFGVVIDAIRNLDADVTSIEAARSPHGGRRRHPDAAASTTASARASTTSTRRACRASPRSPSCSSGRSASIPGRQVWVNPDCGLKTRGYAETVESLREHRRGDPRRAGRRRGLASLARLVRAQTATGPMPGIEEAPALCRCVVGRAGLDRAQHRDDLAEDLGVVAQDRLEVGVAGEQPGVAVALAEDLDRGLVVEHGRDDLAVLRRLLLTDDDPVAVADRGVDHRLTDDLEHEQLALADELAGEREDLVDLLLGGDRDAGGDAADERHHRGVADLVPSRVVVAAGRDVVGRTAAAR